jgi:hypothetical protein
VHERETQIIMQSPARRSTSFNTESRWSGSPSSTWVSQVPHVPSAQEDSTPTPASSTTDRIYRCGGTVRVSSLRCRTTSNASLRTGSAWGFGANRSRCSEPDGQPVEFDSTAASSGSGPQQ